MKAPPLTSKSQWQTTLSPLQLLVRFACLSRWLLSCLPAGDELDERRAKHRRPHSRTLQRSHHRSRRGRSGWWDQVSNRDDSAFGNGCRGLRVPGWSGRHVGVLQFRPLFISVCFQSSGKHRFLTVALISPSPAGAVVSSKGERGKPSRGTSERREQRELEILWSLSSFKWKQLHSPPPPPNFYLLSLFPPFPSHLFSFTLFPPSLHPAPPQLSHSQCCPAAGRLKERCGPTDSTTDFWFLYQ